jgi:hypothetical protein
MFDQTIPKVVGSVSKYAVAKMQFNSCLVCKSPESGEFWVFNQGANSSYRSIFGRIKCWKKVRNSVEEFQALQVLLSL